MLTIIFAGKITVPNSFIVFIIYCRHVVANLPDKGLHLIEKKEKLEKEIRFREDLKITEEKIQKLSLKCASDPNDLDPHSEKLCCFDRRPPRRFRPNISLHSNASDYDNYVKDGAKLLDLPTSLNLQKEQETRTKVFFLFTLFGNECGSVYSVPHFS